MERALRVPPLHVRLARGILTAASAIRKGKIPQRNLS
jgi:hypothetical protein